MEIRTELQKLLYKRLEELAVKHKNKCAERELLDIDVKQLETDMLALNEALNVEARTSGQLVKKVPSNGSRLLGLRLGEAVRILRQETPNISKRKIKNRLQEIKFDFKGKRPGSAVHMAWVVLERQRQKHKDGDS